MAPVLPLRAYDLGAGCVGQAGELSYRFLGGPARIVPGVDGNEKRPLFGRVEIDHVFGHHRAG